MIRRAEDRLRRWLVGREIARSLADSPPMFRCPSCRGVWWHEDGIDAARLEHAVHCHADPVAVARDIAQVLHRYKRSQGR